ncbi:MAG TPA: hypothetical protein VL381_00560 [Rhodocyclaceae bacterium]|nr:hypothetical protein [Rhodocyclaceae bacterium]
MSAQSNKPRELTDQQMLIVAKKICEKHGLFISEKYGMYRVMRKCEPKPVFVGEKKCPRALLAYVQQVTAGCSKAVTA